MAPTGVELWAKYEFWKKMFRVAPLFYGFYGTMILTREPVEAAFWPENRDPDQIKHAISQNIMDFGDFCILNFQNFENGEKLNHASYIILYSIILYYIILILASLMLS